MGIGTMRLTRKEHSKLKYFFSFKGKIVEDRLKLYFTVALFITLKNKIYTITLYIVQER